MNLSNLYGRMPDDPTRETCEALLETAHLRLERIVSFGQATPEGEWYDQPRAEWAVVLRGAAGVLFEGEAAPRALGPGDVLLIPAHARHRVAWTSTAQPTIWLALHHE